MLIGVFEVDEHDASVCSSTRGLVLAVRPPLPFLLPSSIPLHNFAYLIFSGGVNRPVLGSMGIFDVDKCDTTVRSSTRGFVLVVRPHSPLFLPSCTPTYNFAYSSFSGEVYGRVLM